MALIDAAPSPLKREAHQHARSYYAHDCDNCACQGTDDPAAHLRQFPTLHVVGRQLGAAFSLRWQQANPQGHVVHRDLLAEPLPHIDEAATTLLYSLPGDRTDSHDRVHRLVGELRAADLLLVTTPMYNFTVPSALKAWIDHVVWPGLTVDTTTGRGLLTNLPAVVVLTRGGGYGPGTPRAAYNFHEPYLSRVLELVGITDVHFVPAELRQMAAPPAPTELQQLAAASLTSAEQRVTELATTLGRSLQPSTT